MKKNKLTFILTELMLIVLAAFFIIRIFSDNESMKRVAVIVEDSGDKRWEPVVQAIRSSEKLLQATLSGNEQTVAELIEQAHQANASILKYNDENALSCVISLAYYSAQKNYTLHREMPAGKGFADIVFEPNRNCNLPAMIVELKWGHSAEEAVEQIKRKDYLDCLQNYHGEVLLVGVNYDKEKRHTCRIERAVI